MGILPCFRGLPLFALMAFAPAYAAELSVTHSTMAKLAALHPGEALNIDRFPIGATRNATIRFQRVDIYAPDAHLYEITAGGKKEVPRSDRIFLRGYSGDGSARVAISLNPDSSFAEGNGSSVEGSFTLWARSDAHGTHTFSAKSLESTLPTPDSFQFRCGNENVDLGLHNVGDLSTQLHEATSPTVTSLPSSPLVTFRYATIGIDTDSLFMSRLFSNNTANATNWIASMFNTMNTMYENDLQVHLQIGTTILRTSSGSDPYGSFTPGATGTELSFFSNYWKTNETSVSRSFAILLSGQEPSTSGSCSASGIAWIDQYCQKGFTSGSNTVGSYSINQVCTSLAIDPNGTFNARIVGHEIGHNFGAWHTHCTNTSNGTAPTGTNTIDTCFNGESSLGCYSGATTCPAAGSGTIMSYCNFTSVSGCAAGTQNQLKFHTTQINDVLLPAISANTPGCLSTTPDEIFKNGFGG